MLQELVTVPLPLSLFFCATGAVSMCTHAAVLVIVGHLFFYVTYHIYLFQRDNPVERVLVFVGKMGGCAYRHPSL